MKRGYLRLCVIAIIFVTISPFVYAQEVVWGPVVQVTSTTPTSEGPTLVLDQQANSHIVWLEQCYTCYPQHRQVWYKKLDKNGRTLVDNTPVSTASPSTYVPSAGIDYEGNIHVIWEGQPAPFQPSKLFWRKLNGATGIPLTPETEIVQNIVGVPYPKLAIDEQRNVHVVYNNYIPNTRPNLFYVKLDNIGRPSQPIRLNNVDGTAVGGHKLALDPQGNVHVMWGDQRRLTNDFYYTKLDNNGNTLIDDTLVHSTASGIDIDIDREGVNAGAIYIIYTETEGSGRGQVFFKRFDIQNPSPPTQVSNGPDLTGISLLKVDSRQDKIHVAWVDTRDFGAVLTQVYYSKIDTSGNTLIDDTRVTPGRGPFTELSLGLDSNDGEAYAYVVYDDYTQYGQPSELYFQRQYPRIDLTIKGLPCLGSTVLFNLFSYPNNQYILAMSLGNTPGIPLPIGTLPLNFDPLFFLSLSGQVPGFENNIGVLDAQGRAQARWRIPVIPEIRDLTVYLAFVTFNARGEFTSISPGIGVTLPS